MSSVYGSLEEMYNLIFNTGAIFSGPLLSSSNKTGEANHGWSSSEKSSSCCFVGLSISSMSSHWTTSSFALRRNSPEKTFSWGKLSLKKKKKLKLIGYTNYDSSHTLACYQCNTCITIRNKSILNLCNMTLEISLY